MCVLEHLEFEFSCCESVLVDRKMLLLLDCDELCKL